jgi:hypothetical protein
VSLLIKVVFGIAICVVLDYRLSSGVWPWQRR